MPWFTLAKLKGNQSPKLALSPKCHFHQNPPNKQSRNLGSLVAPSGTPLFNTLKSIVNPEFLGCLKVANRLITYEPDVNATRCLVTALSNFTVRLEYFLHPPIRMTTAGPFSIHASCPQVLFPRQPS